MTGVIELLSGSPLSRSKDGFYKAAKYYYYPGWHEPGTTLELIINTKAWAQLPLDLQAIVEAATYKANMWMISEFEAKNNANLKTLVEEHKVKLKRFPDEVLDGLRKISDEVLEELAGKDMASRKVYEHFKAFRENISAWNQMSETPYHNLIKELI